VLDYDALRDVTVDAEVIFHLAAMVGVGQSQYQVSRYTAVNALGTANLLDILANSRHRCRKLIVASSMSTYGEGLYECRRHGRVRPPLRAEAQMAAGSWELACPACGDALDEPDVAALPDDRHIDNGPDPGAMGVVESPRGDAHTFVGIHRCG